MKTFGTFLSLVVLSFATKTDPPIPTPTRHLTWGDVNVVHTTDIHGWILGHPKKVFPELNWSGTFGDFYSFLHHMRTKAKAEHKDLFLVDSGDRRIGHGLTDRLQPGTVNGQLVLDMYHVMGYDVLVPGNHDIDDPAVVNWVMTNLTKQWNGRIVTSNIRRNLVKKLESGGAYNTQPFYGEPFRYWTTKHTQRKVMAYGLTLSRARVARDPKTNIGLLSVTPPKEMVKEEWFLKSLENEVDVFLVVGHIDSDKPCDQDGWIHVYDAIRQKHPFTPIMMFGGHTHKRACTRFTSGPRHYKRSMLIQSGRYFDTVGWMSTALDDNKGGKDLQMTRRYLNNNVPTYKFHTDKSSDEDFHTDVGIAMSDRVYGIDRYEGLSQLYGFLKGDYFLDRKRWSPNDSESMFNLYLDAAEHTLVDKTKSMHWYFFSNWGIIRGDLYRGEFTLGDLYTISPNDPTNFRYTTVKAKHAAEVVRTLQNNVPAHGGCKIAELEVGNSRQMIHSRKNLVWGEQAEDQLTMRAGNSEESLTWGHKTLDVCGEEGPNTPDGEGDDVEHKRIPQVSFDAGPPVYFWRKSWEGGSIDEDADIHLICTNYISNKVPGTLKAIDNKLYENVALDNYGEIRQDELLGSYVRKFMNTIPPDFPMPE